MIRPFYYQGTLNFGDYLNSFLWRDLALPVSDRASTRLIGVGSLLKDTLYELKERKLSSDRGLGTGTSFIEDG